MFLGRRSLQAEYFDHPDRSATVVADGYQQLGRVNRLFRFATPFQRGLPRLLGEENCRCLTLLDVGAGDGSLGIELTEWAKAKGWDWRVTCCDINAHALNLVKGMPCVVARAESLPFNDGTFDVVIAAQMTHHLDSDAAVRAHFSEAWRVARRVVLIHDLHRNIAMYGVLALLLRILRVSPDFREDGLLSVRRGWRLGEWRQLADDAGMTDVRVWLEAGARIILEAKKPLHS